MSQKFQRLVEANVNHYNEHKAQHVLITSLLAAGAVIVMHKLARKFAENDMKLHAEAGRYAR